MSTPQAARLAALWLLPFLALAPIAVLVGSR